MRARRARPRWCTVSSGLSTREVLALRCGSDERRRVVTNSVAPVQSSWSTIAHTGRIALTGCPDRTPPTGHATCEARQISLAPRVHMCIPFLLFFYFPSPSLSSSLSVSVSLRLSASRCLCLPIDSHLCGASNNALSSTTAIMTEAPGAARSPARARTRRSVDPNGVTCAGDASTLTSSRQLARLTERMHMA